MKSGQFGQTGPQKNREQSENLINFLKKGPVGLKFWSLLVIANP